jgi:hypothetical protein
MLKNSLYMINHNTQNWEITFTKVKYKIPSNNGDELKDQ